MNVIGAITAGLAGTAALTMVMSMAPKMDMLEMDIVGMLGSMFGKPNRMLGMVIHLIMGIVFALIYAYVLSLGIGSATWLYGLIFGAVHWLIVGIGMAMIPMMHAGIKSGAVKAPGMWMTNNGGMKAFVGGLMGHMIFGLAAVLVYNLF